MTTAATRRSDFIKRNGRLLFLIVYSGFVLLPFLAPGLMQSNLPGAGRLFGLGLVWWAFPAFDNSPLKEELIPGGTDY